MTTSRTTAGVRVWRRPLALAIALVGVWVLWLVLAGAHTVFLLGFIAVLIAAVFWFPVGWLSHLMPRAAAVVLIILLTLGAIVGTVGVGAPILAEQTKELVSSIPEATARAERWLRRAQRDRTVRQLTNGKDVAGMVKDKVPDVVQTVATVTLPVLGHLVTFISTVILLVVLAGFLVYRPALYQQGIRALLPRTWEPDFDVLWERLGTGLRAWVGGTLVSMCILGSLTAVGLMLAGVEGWFLLGLLTFAGASVPYLGAVASAVPGLLVAFTQSPRHFWLAAAIYIGLHIIEGYCVQPFVMRKAVKLNPALLLFFQSLIGTLVGLLGLIAAAPLLTLVQITVTTLWIERRLHKHPPGLRRRSPANHSEQAGPALQ